MATKTANVTARVQPEIKQKAEAILDQLGIPVSVLIDSLYRQIIMTNGIPYSFRIPALPYERSPFFEHFYRKTDFSFLESLAVSRPFLFIPWAIHFKDL